MRLSTKGRYAVMAMVDLAQHSGGAPISLAEIAEGQEISLSYLEQLFAMLSKGGLVKSVRGPGGGYLLAHDRADTRLTDITLARDETSLASAGRAAATCWLMIAPSPVSPTSFWPLMNRYVRHAVLPAHRSDAVAIG